MNALASPIELQRPVFVPGVFPNIPAETYHATEALSSGGVKKLLRSPQHFRLYRDQPSEPTPAMQFGTAVHCGVLEPDEYDRRIACAPDCDKRTKDGKATWSEFQATNAGKIILSAADFDRARRCIDAVHESPAAQYLLDGAQRELSLFWHDAAMKVPCKARLDLWNGGVGDLKTTSDASPSAFAKTIADYFYHAQAWFYYTGAEHVLNTSPEFFAFIAVESEPPHCVAVYRLDRPSMLAGADLVDTAMRRYQQCLESGVWPGYSPAIEPINVPRWALRSAH